VGALLGPLTRPESVPLVGEIGHRIIAKRCGMHLEGPRRSDACAESVLEPSRTTRSVGRPGITDRAIRSPSVLSPHDPIRIRQESLWRNVRPIGWVWCGLGCGIIRTALGAGRALHVLARVAKVTAVNGISPSEFARLVDAILRENEHGEENERGDR